MEFVSPEGLRLDGRRPMEVYYISLSLSLSFSLILMFFQPLLFVHLFLLLTTDETNSSWDWCCSQSWRVRTKTLPWPFCFCFLRIAGVSVFFFFLNYAYFINFSSAVFEMGNTKVIAAVYGPREVHFYFLRNPVFLYFAIWFIFN